MGRNFLYVLVNKYVITCHLSLTDWLYKQSVAYDDVKTNIEILDISRWAVRTFRLKQIGSLVDKEKRTVLSSRILSNIMRTS